MPEPKKPADRARKQAAAKEPKTTADRVRVQIVGRAGKATVTVLPLPDWGYAWRSHFTTEDFGAFVQDIVAEEDLAAFDATRPSQINVAEFFVAYGEAVGEDLGELQASQAS